MSTAAFIDSTAHPAASPFYHWCRAEYIQQGRSIGVSIIYEVPHMNLINLLETMIDKTTRGQNILICCHGTPETLSLHLPKPKDNKENYGIDPDRVDHILNPKYYGKPIQNMTHKDWIAYAKPIITTPDAAKKLAILLPQIRQKEYQHLAIRACNIANESSGRVMLGLKKLFNANSISAPRVRDAYAGFIPGIADLKIEAPKSPLVMERNMPEPETTDGKPRKKNGMDDWLKDHSGAVIWGAFPHRFAIHTKWDPNKEAKNQHSFKPSGCADSLHAIHAWIAAKYSPYIDKYQPKKTLYLHSLYDNAMMHYPREDGFRRNIRYIDAVTRSRIPFDPLEGIDLDGPMVY